MIGRVSLGNKKKKKLKEECDCVFDALANQINYKNGEFHVLRNAANQINYKNGEFHVSPILNWPITISQSAILDSATWGISRILKAASCPQPNPLLLFQYNSLTT